METGPKLEGERDTHSAKYDEKKWFSTEIKSILWRGIFKCVCESETVTIQIALIFIIVWQN